MPSTATFMNEFDVEDAVDLYSDEPSVPNLGRAARIVKRLMDWTDRNSDGWPYWSKPQMASDRLRALIQGAARYNPEDISDADLKAALSPLKAFLTRQHVDHALILNDPAPVVDAFSVADAERAQVQPFTSSMAIHLQPVMDAVTSKARIKYLDEDGSTVREGTARHLVEGPEDYGFFVSTGDIRDAYLRVTLNTGMDYAVKVSRLMDLVAKGGFMIVDKS